MGRSRLAGCSHSVATGRGFTLIETLVALVIAAVGAAVVLSHVRTLMLRSEREQAHQLAVLQLLNDSLRLSHGGLPASAPYPERDTLLIKASPTEAQPSVRVWNYSLRGDKLPPIAFAYTPFQLFGVSRDRYTLHAIALGLRSKELPDSPTPANPPAAGRP